MRYRSGARVGVKVRGCARLGRAVGGPPTVAVQVLLDPAAAAVKGVAGQPNDVERIRHRDGVGQSSAAAVLNPVIPSIATTSTPSPQDFGRLESQVVNACFERPETMSRSLAGPVPPRIGVRATIHGDVLVPEPGVAPDMLVDSDHETPSNQVGSSISTQRPSARTASFAVCHDTARASAIRAIVRCQMTSPTRAQRTAALDSFVRGSAAFVVSCPTHANPAHR